MFTISRTFNQIVPFLRHAPRFGRQFIATYFSAIEATLHRMSEFWLYEVGGLGGTDYPMFLLDSYVSVEPKGGVRWKNYSGKDCYPYLGRHQYLRSTGELPDGQEHLDTYSKYDSQFSSKYQKFSQVMNTSTLFEIS